MTYVYGVDLGKGMKYSGINRQPVAYNQISPSMLAAIVAIEDNRFWEHGALDVKGTLRALVNDLEHKPIQGGSTLEQQYVKNVLILQSLDDPAAQQAAAADTMSRKIDQLRMAVQVAHAMSKQEILAGYLNDSYFGSGAWGVEAAAETYFSTTAAKLTMLQAATLAGIVENPSKYNPLANPATAAERRNTVLARISQTNPTVLGAADAVTLEHEKLVLHHGTVQSGCTADTVGDTAYFCDYVMHTLLLDSQLGSTHRGAGQAARHRRPQGLHHDQPEGPGRGDQGGQLGAAAELQDLQPGAQRRHRGADPAGHRQGARDRRGPAVRHRPGADRGRLRGQQPVRRRRRACRPVRRPSCSP